MLERFAARRFLRQSKRTKEEISAAGALSVLDSDRVASEHRAHGYVILPEGTSVLVDSTISDLKRRQRSPLLGVFTLQDDVEGEVYSWERKKVHDHMDSSTTSLDFGLTSSKKRELDVEVMKVNAELLSIANEDEIDQVEEERVAEDLFSLMNEQTAEIARITQEVLRKNPQIRDFLYDHHIDPSRVTELLFTVPVFGYVKLDHTF